MIRIQVCFIINSLKKCGPSEVLYNQVNAIDHTRYKVTIITLLDDNDEKYIADRFFNFEIVKLGYPKKVSTLFKCSEISKKIDLYNFDILHIHGHVTNYLIHKSICKKIVTVHNRLYEDFKDVYGHILGLLVHYLNLHYLKKTDKIVFCSESALIFSGKYKLNATFIRNGINSHITCNQISASRKNFRSDLEISESSFIYLYAGALTETKNVKAMIKFFDDTLLPNEYLLILGDGKYFDYLKKFESSKIKIIGFKENVIEYMQASDCYVSFSKSEGLPISIIEALSCNLALFISDIPSHMEFFSLNKKIYIGEFFSEGTVKQKLDLVRKNKKIESHMVYEEFLTDMHMMRDYQEIYEQIVGGIGC